MPVPQIMLENVEAIQLARCAADRGRRDVTDHRGNRGGDSLGLNAFMMQMWPGATDHGADQLE